MKKNFKIGIIGLGYVGLPLAVEFSKKFNVVGFDIDSKRVLQLKKGIDKTNEVSKRQILNSSKSLEFTVSTETLSTANFFIVTVPTPITKSKPDLKSIVSASRMIGSFLKQGDIVVYESTVYPGVTRDICRNPKINLNSNLITTFLLDIVLKGLILVINPMG